MTSKKKLKKRMKRLRRKVGELQDTTIGTLWFIANMIKVWDSNMELVQKTLEMIVAKINAIEDTFLNKDGIVIDNTTEATKVTTTNPDDMVYDSTESNDTD